MKKPEKNILLGVTASIAAYKACELINLFRKEGFSVRCVMSGDAAHFVTPLTLETLSGRKAACGMFGLPEERDPIHISLADEADIVVVAPATADIIARVAAGLCDDILSCAILSATSPVLFAPAMNSKMYLNPIIQEKIKYLKKKGYHFVGPVKGRLVCGHEGIGHIAPLGEIVKRAKDLLA